MAFLNLPINTFLVSFFYRFFIIFFICIKYLKLCQLNIIKEINKGFKKTKKRLVKDIKIFLKRKKKKKRKCSRESYKNLSEDEKINWSSVEKKLQNEKKRFIIIIRKYFNLENFASLLGKV